MSSVLNSTTKLQLRTAEPGNCTAQANVYGPQSTPAEISRQINRRERAYTATLAGLFLLLGVAFVSMSWRSGPSLYLRPVVDDRATLSKLWHILISVEVCATLSHPRRY